ncbi:MAG: hypothetical protein ACREAM_22665 [Blastocatellia bacterium]
MMKAFKKVTFTLLISSVLAFNGLAQSNDYWQKPKQDKPKEQPKETPKKGGDDRGGKDKGEKKDKKPDGASF